MKMYQEGKKGVLFMTMRRMISICLTLVLAAVLFTPALAAEQTTAAAWTRSEGDGSYVTIRLSYPEGSDLSYSEQEGLVARYADTGEPIALSSSLYGEYFFATVPADNAGRPIEVYPATPARFEDCITVWQGVEYESDLPIGAKELNVRGVVNGTGGGNLSPDASLTRAEAFAMIVRLLDLPAPSDQSWEGLGNKTWFSDVPQDAWYYDTASAALAAGIAAEDVRFNPNRPVTRAEFTVMVARAFRTLGWLESSDADLRFADADAIPAWALDAYRDLDAHGVSITTVEFADEPDAYGDIATTFLAEPGKTATRGEVIEFLYNALRFLPCYPTEAAIAWGFDKEMPVIDGSTSTYPYTTTLFNTMFINCDCHPNFPQSHSKSYYSYDRLISGEADLLIISTKPTEDTLAKAKEAGVELELTPIAYDAMVFFTNSENPVDGLTMDQIRTIYVENPYTNWTELGGPDAAFIPYCRNMDSGSQAQMEEFFLKGDEIHPDIRRETTSVSMASVLTDVAGAYQEDPLTYALGYSIYYYYQSASQILLGENELKLLEINGVYPTDETIADGSYPLSGYNYAVVRADEPKDSPARRMVDFLLSEGGQICVQNAGFGPLDPQDTAF